MQKYIGIPSNVKDGRLGCNVDYAELLQQCGYSPIALPAFIDYESFMRFYGWIDGILLPGGSDVLPSRYAKRPSFFTEKSDPILEHFDANILPSIYENLPIFGICRGLQTLNVFFGGNLHQHLHWHPYSSYEKDIVHKIVTSDGMFGVCSFHHQAIDVLADGFSVLATSEKDAYIEVISHKKLKIAAVQWHPERIFDAFSIELIKKTFS